MKETEIVNSKSTAGTDGTSFFSRYVGRQALNDASVIEYAARIFTDTRLEKVLTVLPDDSCLIFRGEFPPGGGIIENVIRPNFKTNSLPILHAVVEYGSCHGQRRIGVEYVLMVHGL